MYNYTRFFILTKIWYNIPISRVSLEICILATFFMKEPTYRQALLNSWRLVWHNKLLWILGLCSVALGQWGLSDFVGQLYVLVQNGFVNADFSALGVLKLDWGASNVLVVLLVVGLAVLILAFLAAIIFVSVSARGALISVAIAWYKNQKNISAARAWRDGVKNFLNLFGLTLAGKLTQTAVLLILSMIALKWGTAGSFLNSLFVALSCGVALFLAMAIEAISVYAAGYVVLDKAWLGHALKKGWRLFSKHILVSLELALGIILLDFLLVSLLILGSYVAFAPSLLLWVVAAAGGWQILATIGLVLGLALMILFIALLAGLYNAFITCAWIYLFMKMHKEGILSRVIYHLKNIFRKG